MMQNKHEKGPESARQRDTPTAPPRRREEAGGTGVITRAIT